MINLENPNTHDSDQEKELVKESIILGVFELMQRAMSMSPKNRAIKRSKRHRQSKSGLARIYTIFNILTGEQKLPSHPRDFKLDLPEDQRIPRWDFHSVLRSLVRNGLLRNKKDNFFYPRGRPIKERLGEERRGNPGYYEESELKEIIDECLADSEILKEIHNSILRSNLFFRFIKYSFQTHLYQIQLYENAFRNSNRLAIMKTGIREVVILDRPWVLVRDLNDQRIDMLCEAYARRTIQKFSDTKGNVLYTLLVISFILYDNQFGQKNHHLKKI